MMVFFLAVHLDQESTSVSEISMAREALQHNQIVFVGQSDHLAELHYYVCREVLHSSVNRIDSVKNITEFTDWMEENASNIREQKGKMLVVVDCQFEKLATGCRHSHDAGQLLAEKVVKCLAMNNAFSVGLALLTCPFMIHDAAQVEKLQETIETNPFERQLISSDFRKLSQFIGNMYALPKTAGSEKSQASSEEST